MMKHHDATQLKQQAETLPALIDKAANCLASARTSAEILEARDRACIVYGVAKGAARMVRAKQAHDDILKKVYRAQADALLIEAQAKIRLADEYDAAQERGEVGKSGARTDLVPVGNEVTPSAANAGLTRKQIHEARQVRDAESVAPGIAKRTVEAAKRVANVVLQQALDERQHCGGNDQRQHPLDQADVALEDGQVFAQDELRFRAGRSLSQRFR